MDTYYSTNNKKSHTLSSIPYTQVSTNESTENENIYDKSSNINNAINNYKYYNVGEGLYSQLDKETIATITVASSWGYFLCFIHLIIGVFLFFLAGIDDYFYLICIAFVAHTFSVCLGIFSVSRKNVLLIVNYTIYSVVILAITISIFIISTIVSNYWYQWWIILGVFFFLNVQIIGIKYLFSLAMNLKGLQTKEMENAGRMYPTVNTIPVQTVSQPQQLYVPQPAQYYYVGFPQQPQQMNMNPQYYQPPVTSQYAYTYPQGTEYNNLYSSVQNV
ncbi:hypothetical protein PPL_07355 [Heterostelium album PN500]|uniref:Uncharacterized protein n=1 Tax=Heterostelium pallidum (strain ATCC 26659 / Pp 5 / PN500) TaxID=670386 RepID=D3BF38_HETP5|nr:hypothetical protein PPL_07355 [Heterostelium album PN500]EFA80519.1 hypothetical protein PPL_07355 [Heterostelium album PN500]|eukprot:XP_020432639.1 hypothetical protein PPL_07355 [Heterostelium album PN500]